MLFLLTITACLLGILILMALYWLTRNRKQTDLKPTPADNADAFVSPNPCIDLMVRDSSDQTMIEGVELDLIPSGARFLPMDSKPVKQLAHGVSDLLKGAVGLPNKTVRIAFDPKVQQGLDSGALRIMEAKGGGLRTIAVETETGKIAGHGRVLEGGRARQLLSGAFNVLSIAVAQAHLAEINQAITSLNQKVDDIIKLMEAKDQAAIESTLDYLKYVANYLERNKESSEFPQEKRNLLEDIRRDVMTWVRQLRQEAINLSKRIEEQKDEDTFGIGNTYNKLQKHAEDAKRLVLKRNYVFSIANMLDVVTAYLDPTGRDQPLGAMLADESYRADDKFKGMAQGLNDKAHELLSRVTFASSDGLQQKKKLLLDEKSGVELLLEEQTKGVKNLHETLRQHSNSYCNDQRISFALTFDEHGAVNKVAALG